jgi:succinate dehydrogenase / fumarate reductase flavoprotein subunit
LAADGTIRALLLFPAGFPTDSELEVCPPRAVARSPAQNVGIHPDIADFQDLAHAFDLKSATVAARPTLEVALEREETRGCHNRADYPQLDESLQINFVWSSPGRIKRESIPPIPEEIAALMRDVSTAGKLVE